MDLSLIIKSIRKHLGLSQEDFANNLNIKRSNLSQMEIGRNTPSVALLNDIANIFHINIKIVFQMINSDEKDLENLLPLLTMEDSDTSSNMNAKDCNQNCNLNCNLNTPFLPKSGKTKSTNIVSLPIPVEPDEELVSVPLVDISVAAGTGFNNPTYMEEIDCIRFPQSMIKGNYTYLCVRIKGESMVPTLQDGGYLVVRLLDRSEWENIRDGHVYVVSDNEGKAYVKRIKNRLKEYGIIICNSDNPDPMGYPSFNLQENELNSIWHAEWYISAKMPNIHATYYNKVSELECAFDNMRREFKEELLQMRKEIRAVLPQ